MPLYNYLCKYYLVWSWSDTLCVENVKPYFEIYDQFTEKQSNSYKIHCDIQI